MSNLTQLETDLKTPIAMLVTLLYQLVQEQSGPEAKFAQREVLALEISNEVVRQVLQQDLQQMADRQTVDVLIDQHPYHQHEPGTVEYHSLCGPLQVCRYTYRPRGMHNGKTVVALELQAGLIHRATPALAYDVAQGYAKEDMRSHQESLQSAHRVPPSRTTLETLAKAIGGEVQVQSPVIEPIVRQQEEVPPKAASLSLGLDRTTVPMEEKREPGQAPKTRRKKRTKPYVRKPPEPVDVNWRMAYIGTVAVADGDGETLFTRRYTALPQESAEGIMKRIAADIQAYRGQRPELAVGVIQDGAPELWNVAREELCKIMPERDWVEGIDRYHLEERLGKALELLPMEAGQRKTLLKQWQEKLDEDDTMIDKIESTLRAWYNRLDETTASKLWEQLVYIRNNKDRMRYATLLSKGLPVGSGITEAACKSVIGQRTAGSGQRWCDEGVSAALTLRALHRSARLPAFWTYYSSTYCKEVLPAA